jgi:hypothetical protein
MSERSEEIKRRQAECDCNPNFHVCTAIAEMEALEDYDRAKDEREKAERLETLRAETLTQAKFIKTMAVRGMVEFCDNVIELLEKETG